MKKNGYQADLQEEGEFEEVPAQNAHKENTIQLDGLETNDDEAIFPNADRFPYCIVWTAIPLITWLIPFIGHTGIALSNGVIHDFAGPYFISVDHFAFGKPLKYVRVRDSSISKEKHDSAVQKADGKFCHLMHNLFFNNCHSHVAEALNQMAYKNKTNWTMISVCILLVLSGRYVSVKSLMMTYLPFLIILAICIFFLI